MSGPGFRPIVVLLSLAGTLLGVVPPAAQAPRSDVEYAEGAIIRGPVARRQLALVFTGHEFAEGAEAILDALAQRRLRASFFLTGAFLRDAAKAPHVRRMVRDGHYVGAHSDAHLLYCPWSGPKTTLVSRQAFVEDLERNYEALRPFGVQRSDAPYFLPPYEWYNAEIADWTRAAGFTLICHTPGTRSNADYTEEGTREFVSSDTIFQSILARERSDPHGLNGFMLLLHVGAGPGRSDKFHARFAGLLDQLSSRGYGFVRVNELLGLTIGRLAAPASAERSLRSRFRLGKRGLRLEAGSSSPRLCSIRPRLGIRCVRDPCGARDARSRKCRRKGRNPKVTGVVSPLTARGSRRVPQ